MKITINILIALTLLGCSRNTEGLKGDFVAINDLIGDGYATIDIEDSIVLLNKYSVFYDERDTIIIDPKRKTFIRSNRNLFPIYDFKAIKDTVYLSYSYDAGEETIKFIRSEISPMFKYFAESSIDIQLMTYNNETVVLIEQNKVLNLIIGRLKEGVDWPNAQPDSIFIEFERYDYLGNKELSELIGHTEQVQDPVLCLHFDKRVPTEVMISIRNKIKNTVSASKVVESRITETGLVYIK